MKINELSGVIQIKRQGPPSVLEYTTEILSEPGEYQVLLSQKAISINFVDVLFRNGTFPVANFPATIGVEAAGTIEAIGNGIKDFSVGDRVAYYFSLGAYAEHRIIDANKLVRIPDDITFDQAASTLAKGLTARMLVKQAYPVQPGNIVLVHAAAGGVGALVAKWAKSLGATVIGTVGNAEKKATATQEGVEHVIALDTENLGETVLSLTKNRGVDVAFDGVGKATFEQSTHLIKTGGTAVLFGSASGEPAIDQTYISKKHINLIRPVLGQYLQDKSSVQIATTELFEAMRSGALGSPKPMIFALSEIAKAHKALETSQTIGAVILHP